MKGCFRRLLTSEAADPSRLHRPLPPPQYSLALALYRGGGAVTPYNVLSLPFQIPPKLVSKRGV